MSLPAIGLLKLLAGAGASLARPGRAGAADSAGGADFKALLEQARKGELASGREVTLASGCGVTLTDSQLQRLAAAADRAEAQGVGRAIVLIDGMAIRLDVSIREVTGAADLSAGGVLTDIDAVIGVPPDTGAGAATGAAGSPSVLPLPAGPIGSASLLRALASRAPSRAAG
ncbi:MAG: hypothetical protein WD749_14140 [Phycisphaerales bacterium]